MTTYALRTKVQILKDQLGNLRVGCRNVSAALAWELGTAQIGDSVVFKVTQNQLGIPQAR